MARDVGVMARDVGEERRCGEVARDVGVMARDVGVTARDVCGVNLEEASLEAAKALLLRLRKASTPSSLESPIDPSSSSSKTSEYSFSLRKLTFI